MNKLFFKKYWQSKLFLYPEFTLEFLTQINAWVFIKNVINISLYTLVNKWFVYKYKRERKRDMDADESLSNALKKLRTNLSDIASVMEWADLMGYNDPKYFSEKFLLHYDIRPLKMMSYIRLKSIFNYLKSTEYSNHKIARLHSLSSEKALNKYTNYHLGHSPTDLKTMSEEKLHLLLEQISETQGEKNKT